MSIKSRLVASFTGIIAVLVTALLLLVFVSYKSTLDDELRKNGRVSISELSLELVNWFAPRMQQLETFESLLSSGVCLTPRDLLPAFKMQMTRDAETTSIYYCTRQHYRKGGDFVDGSDWVPDADYDPYSRDWWLQAATNSGTVFVQPYVDAQTKKVVVTLARRVERGGDLLGVIAVDLYLTHLDSIVSNKKHSPNAKTWLVDPRGLFITHQQQDHVLKKAFLMIPC